METYLSDYIGKSVVFLNGEYAGYVTGAKLSKKLDAVRALVCADEEEEEFILPMASVHAFGDGGVIIKSKAGKLPKEMQSAPIGMRVLTEKGNYAGTVQDFAGEDKQITLVILSSGERYSVEKIHGFGECLILNLSDKKPPVGKRAKKQEPKTPSVKPLQEIAAAVAESSSPAETPVTVSAGSNLLTGKRVPRDISDVRGNVIIRKGCVITPEILKHAVFHNKLFELTVCVLSPD